MDDLLGEDWQSTTPQLQPSNAGRASNPSIFASNLSSLRASPQLPLSSSASPLNPSRPSSTVTGGLTGPQPKSSTGNTQKQAGDAFGNLTAGLKTQSTTSTGNGLSIQERQRRLVEERNRQMQEHGQFWDSLGGGSQTQQSSLSNVTSSGKPAASEDVEDILAAFNKDVKVDNSSHFPPPGLQLSQPGSGQQTPAGRIHNIYDDVDDDTFGLGELKHGANGLGGRAHSQPNNADDDDILGELAAPVKPKQDIRKESNASSGGDANGCDEHVAKSKSHRRSSVPKDQALAELVEMGFAPETASIALAENGRDVQRSVGWLLQQAHAESKQQAREQMHETVRTRNGSTSGRASQGPTPAWMQSDVRSNGDGRSRQNGGEEKDAGQLAQDLGSKLFKSANSLWKASQKQMAKTIAEFQQERDPSQPKWMQNGHANHATSGNDIAERQRRHSQQQAQSKVSRSASITNEAALLDMPRESDASKTKIPEPRPRPSNGTDRRGSTGMAASREQALNASKTELPSRPRNITSKLSRQEVDAQSAQAYISPARRKRTTPKPEVRKQDDNEVDLFSPAPTRPAVSNIGTGIFTNPTNQKQASATPKSTASARQVPPTSSSALASSAQHRRSGGEAFKRGDYSTAHEAYTAALTAIPPTHPIVIVILSNRALTALKTGDAKTAVSDADRALKLIGPSFGHGESIVVDEGADGKEMRDFFGKALMRKAEALEHLEKWSEAAVVWRQAVEAGVGGAISIRGKQRCEKATMPAPANKPVSNNKVAAKSLPSPLAKTRQQQPTSASKTLGNSMHKTTAVPPSSGAAVKKLREANAAAEKTDDEKFRLADQVEARLTTWKGGKADNLRALLQSMDNVLWPEAGWKKVGMSDLVMPNKVKIIYMKAIAKVHPDKIAQDASTEQRMISGAVFSTLNEAWDKFRKDNNL